MTSRRHLKHFNAASEEFLRLSGHRKTSVRLRVPFVPEKDVLSQLISRFSKEKLISDDAPEAQLQIIEDKELIGGFVATCNGYQIDTSLKTALARLRRKERRDNSCLEQSERNGHK